MNKIEFDLPLLERTNELLEAILAELRSCGTPYNAVLAEQAGEDEQPGPAEEDKPTVTVDDLKRRVTTLTANRPGLKAEVRTLVKEYATKVSAIPEDKLSEVWDRLDKLEGSNG